MSLSHTRQWFLCLLWVWDISLRISHPLKIFRISQAAKNFIGWAFRISQVLCTVIGWDFGSLSYLFVLIGWYFKFEMHCLIWINVVKVVMTSQCDITAVLQMHGIICVMSQMNLKCIVFHGLLLLMYYDITAMTSQQMHGCICVMSHIFQIHRLMCDVILFF